MDGISLCDRQFAKHQYMYLELEESITVKAPCVLGNVVLDSTGSVCYLADSTLSRIKRNFFVLHLEASDGMIEKMIDGYFATPKPVVWGGRLCQVFGDLLD